MNPLSLCNTLLFLISFLVLSEINITTVYFWLLLVWYFLPIHFLLICACFCIKWVSCRQCMIEFCFLIHLCLLIYAFRPLTIQILGIVGLISTMCVILLLLLSLFFVLSLSPPFFQSCGLIEYFIFHFLSLPTRSVIHLFFF